MHRFPHLTVEIGGQHRNNPLTTARNNFMSFICFPPAGVLMSIRPRSPVGLLRPSFLPSLARPVFAFPSSVCSLFARSFPRLSVTFGSASHSRAGGPDTQVLLGIQYFCRCRTPASSSLHPISILMKALTPDTDRTLLTLIGSRWCCYKTTFMLLRLVEMNLCFIWSWKLLK